MRHVTEKVLLVGVAVSALSGCMTVPGSSTPGGDTRPDSASESPGKSGAAPKSAKPSPREGGSRPDPDRTRQGRGKTNPAAGAPDPAPAPERAAEPAPAPVPAGRPPVVGGGKAPEVRLPAPREAPDLCGLGRQFGQWTPDSAEARICQQNYG